VEHDYYATGLKIGISGFPGYFACVDGHIYSAKPWRGSGFRRLAEGKNRDGYRTVQLQLSGKSVTRPIHRIVCTTFKGPMGGLEVRHLDGDKENNSSENLEWGTQKDNADDRERHGKTARGENNRGGGNKLTMAEAKEIKAHLASGLTHKFIASKYGVSIALVSFIKSGREWRRA